VLGHTRSTGCWLFHCPKSDAWMGVLPKAAGKQMWRVVKRSGSGPTMAWPPGEGGSGGPPAKERRRGAMELTYHHILFAYNHNDSEFGA
jgi:hypothetical protein